MRSEPWLDTEHYPLITFDGKEIEPRRPGYTIKGELTLKGVTRRIEIPFDFRGVVSDLTSTRSRSSRSQEYTRARSIGGRNPKGQATLLRVACPPMNM